jgi:hypothetical protein
MLPEANAALVQNAKFYLRELTPAEKSAILAPNAGVEQNTGLYARITNRDSVHWHADIVLRLISMYGSNGSVAAGRMGEEAESKSLEYIWHYVRILGTLEKADYAQSKTWYYWSSENHHAMDFRTHWHFSMIAKDHPDYRNRTASVLEKWRLDYFGAVENTGRAADLADPNGDGETNLIEFATAQNPNATTRATPTLFRSGPTPELTYTRSHAALADGVTFTAEWSDTLAAGSWSSVGVTEQILSNTGTVQTVKAAVSSGSGKRFVRLRVTGP